MTGVYLVDTYDHNKFSSVHRPNREVHICDTPARTSAIERVDKPVHISKSSMVHAIRVHLMKLLGAPSDADEE